MDLHYEYAMELERSIKLVKQEIHKLDMTNYNPGLVSAFLDRRGLLPHQQHAHEVSRGLDIWQERRPKSEAQDEREVKERRMRVMRSREKSLSKWG